MLKEELRCPPLTEDDPLLPRPHEFKGIRPSTWGFTDLFEGSEWGYIAELMLRFAIHRNTGWEPIPEEDLLRYARVPGSVLRSLYFHHFPARKRDGGADRGGQVLRYFTTVGVRMMHRRVVGRGAEVHSLPRPSCIALDYDFTLARFQGGFSGLHRLLSEHGRMPIEQAKSAHELAETKGFTPERLIECAEELGYNLDSTSRVEFYNAFNQWLRSSLHLYQEAREASARWADVPVHIVSFGNREYQRSKINTLCVPHIEAHIVQEPKVVQLRKLHEQYGGPIWFFDDNPEEHNALRDSGLTDEQVICLLVTRRESPHYKKIARHPHRRVTSLLDVHWE